MVKTSFSNQILNECKELLKRYGAKHMVRFHSREKNLMMPLHGLLVLTSSKGSFICTKPQNSVRHPFRIRVDPLSYFSFQPVLHDWCNKGCGMCYPVCGMVHIKEPLLLIDKSSLCGGSGFPFSLSEWSLTICLTPYNRR